MRTVIIGGPHAGQRIETGGQNQLYMVEYPEPLPFVTSRDYKSFTSTKHEYRLRHVQGRETYPVYVHTRVTDIIQALIEGYNPKGN